MPNDNDNGTGLLRVRLSEPDLGHLEELLAEIESRAGDANRERLVEIVHDVARKLDTTIRSPLDSMRWWERPVGVVFSGYRVDDDGIGPSPASWRSVTRRQREALLLLLMTAPLGEPFAYRTQQDGRLVHDILPTQGDEHAQLGSSSSTELLWHTEDAFHESRCDYIALLCLRNDERTSTTVSAPDVSLLSPRTRETLSRPLFRIKPDDSHFRTRNPESGDDPTAAGQFDDMERRAAAPPPIPVLFGPADWPYLRIDPAYMSPVPDDAEAALALAEVSELVDQSLQEIALGPGDLLVLDNFRAVHGRRPFRARYDGRSRWLKRVSVTRDLRRQRTTASTMTGLVV